VDLTGAPRHWLQSKAGSYSFEINIRGCGVGVVGVNTAWLCKDDHDRHRLTPGIHLLDDALAEIKNSRLKIVLGHHPLDWLEDDQAQQLRVLLGSTPPSICTDIYTQMNAVMMTGAGRLPRHSMWICVSGSAG